MHGSGSNGWSIFGETFEGNARCFLIIIIIFVGYLQCNRLCGNRHQNRTNCIHLFFPRNFLRPIVTPSTALKYSMNIRLFDFRVFEHKQLWVYSDAKANQFNESRALINRMDQNYLYMSWPIL